MTTTKLIEPAPLDSSKLHTRTEYRNWQNAVADYHNAVRAEQEAAARQAAAKTASASRLISDDEYDQMASKREAERIERAAARDAEEKARQDEMLAYLDSTPEVAELDASNPYRFIQLVIHWAQKGYSLPEDADIAAFPNWYAVQLNAPVAPAPAKKAK